MLFKLSVVFFFVYFNQTSYKSNPKFIITHIPLIFRNHFLCLRSIFFYYTFVDRGLEVLVFFLPLSFQIFLRKLFPNFALTLLFFEYLYLVMIWYSLQPWSLTPYLNPFIYMNLFETFPLSYNSRSYRWCLYSFEFWPLLLFFTHTLKTKY